MLKRNSIFLTLSLILVVVLGLALLYIPKDQLHLLLCDRHSPARDLFYRYYTTLAEWLPYVVCVALLLFGRIGDGIFASSAMLLSTFVTQVSKHIVNAPRPLTWFTEHFPDVQLPLVEGVRMNLWYSFPSGHTTSFFAMAFAVCILLTQRILQAKPVLQRSGHTAQRSYSAAIQILLFFLAALGAYSRIYLSQHFAADVFAGVLVGVLSTLIAYAVFYRYQGEKWYNYRFFTKK